MKHNVLAPSVGESITEVSILKWLKKSGQSVKSGELLLEIESDKATVEIVAEASGALTVLKADGERIPVGEVIGSIDDSVQGSAAPEKAAAAPQAPASAPAATQAAPAASATVSASQSGATPGPAARKMAAEQGVDTTQMTGSGKDGRVTQGDLLQAKSQPSASAAPVKAAQPASAPSTLTSPSAASSTPSAPRALKEGERRVPMSNLRARIAERLVQAQHTAAILTTFNEVDMSAVNAVRTQHKEAFKAKHGVALSYMSFFTRACVEALRIIPEVNASIEGRDVIYHDFQDIGIAVGSERGLVVPIIRGAGQGALSMGFVDIEKKIAELAGKARDGKLSIADMSGGTFTISNGGTYGSLMSTPILTPPQSGILGMHKIQDRPVAINGKVEIRPMMYLALSYDHRLIDGKGAVTFLVTLKDLLEHPEKLSLQF